MNSRAPDHMEAVRAYGEPCNNCKRWWKGSWCIAGHRIKGVTLDAGPFPELAFRKLGGCPDHKTKVGEWWHIDTPKRHQSGYGGSSTNLLF